MEAILGLIDRFFGVPLCFIDKVVYRWNFNAYKSKAFANYQAGGASGFVLCLILSPALIISGPKYFLATAISILVFVLLSTNWISKRIRRIGKESLVNEYVSKNPGKSSLIVVSTFAVLVTYTLIWAFSIGPWK